MSAPVGIFGLGLIGTALAGRLRAAGMPVMGYDPDPTRLADFVASGGLSASAEAIWADCATAIVAVFDGDQVEAVLATAPAVGRTLVIITSTCDPERIAALSARAPAGLRLVEAPISGASREVAAGDAVFLLGGDPEATAAAGPILSILGRAAHDLGPLGSGSRAKLAINLILGLNRAALAEGLVFGALLGLDPARLLAVAQDSAAASAVMATKGPLMVEGRFQPQGRVAQSAKDFGLILAAAGVAGQALPGAESYLALMRDCMAAGEGDLDNAAIIRAIARRGPAGVAPARHAAVLRKTEAT